MGQKSMFQAVTVQDCRGKVFGYRIEQPPAFNVLGELSGGLAGYNMRTLSTAIRLLAETQATERVLVPVSADTIDKAGMDYVQLLMTIPEGLRWRMYVEVRSKGRVISRQCAAFAQAIQDQCGMSIAAWAVSNDLPSTEKVTDALSPALLMIDPKCLKLAMSAGDRSFMLDVAEVASSCGARTLVTGVETAVERDSMLEIGVDLLAGSLVSVSRCVEEGELEVRPSIVEKLGLVSPQAIGWR